MLFDGFRAFLQRLSFSGSPKRRRRKSQAWYYRTEALEVRVLLTSLTNNAPDAVDDTGDDTGATNQNEPVILDVLANDIDIDDDQLRVADVGQPSNGAVEVNVDGTITYTPAVNFIGTDQFVYLVTDRVDSSGSIDVGRVTVTVGVGNNTPTIEDQVFTLPENTATDTVIGQILADDVDGDDLFVVITSGNESGAFTVTRDGLISVGDSSQLDFETTPAFSLTVYVSDGDLSETANVTIQLTDVDEFEPPSLDIKPFDASNRIRFHRNARINVAIISTVTFDATRIDFDELTFGKTGNEDSLRRVGRHDRPRIRFVDINRDGRLDVIATFDLDRTGLSANDTQAILRGTTIDGQTFEATDAVNFRRFGRPKRVCNLLDELFSRRH